MDKTILIPNMAPLHFELLVSVFRRYGYDVRILRNEGPSVVQAGLESVHNDACYPALLVIGQFLDALGSGEYDLNHVALMITQTGGGCRASNYIHLLRKALVAKEYDVPVYSLNFSGLDGKSGFSLTLGMILQMLSAVILADALMLVTNQVRPYEAERGACDRLTDAWLQRLKEMLEGQGLSKRAALKATMSEMVRSFRQIPRREARLIKVGIIGEIYEKYSSLGNNHLEEFLASQGCEVRLSGIWQFLVFKADNRLEDAKLYGGGAAKKLFIQWLLGYMSGYEEAMRAALMEGGFEAPASYAHLKKLAGEVIGAGCKMGEGWLLTAEALELIEQGFANIVCAQPFGCLPNHIVAKGMVRAIKQLHPEANLTMIDYDPGATRVNQENRIKLMLSMAAK